MDPVYHQLARHLDNLPGGFPPTDSGVEFRILQRLFTLQDAALALKLTVNGDTHEHAGDGTIDAGDGDQLLRVHEPLIAELDVTDVLIQRYNKQAKQGGGSGAKK